ncbi:MAG: hypothetical protein KY476_18725, partial [Planctomycetes bacterium]|nr:hypothetical protein [Planctomycetota bacterium]
MRRFTNPTFVLTAFALALGIVIGCNFGAPEQSRSRAEAGPPSPADYVHRIQGDITRIRKAVVELSGDDEFADVPPRVLIAATCRAYDFPLETYRFLTDGGPADPAVALAEEAAVEFAKALQAGNLD